MVELEKASFGAAALRANERALTAITFPDFSPDRRRNVARAGHLCTRWPRSVHRRDLRPLEVRKQHAQGTVEYQGWIAVWNGVAQEILNAPQLLVRHAPDGELHFEAFRRERRDHGRQ